VIVTPDDGATSIAERTTATIEGQSIFAGAPKHLSDPYRSELFRGGASRGALDRPHSVPRINRLHVIPSWRVCIPFGQWIITNRRNVSSQTYDA
jgi:hypothetical protein